MSRETWLASPRVVLAGATSAQAAVSFVSVGLPAIGPALRREFGLSLPALGAVLTANLLGSGLALIAAGLAVNRFGARAATLAGTALAVAGLAAAAFAHSASLLFAMLLVSGVGSAVVPIAGAGALFRAYGPQRRAFAMGVRQMAVPVGGMAASLLLPTLNAVGGARLALLVGAGLGGLAGTAFALLAGAGELPARGPGLGFRRILQAPGMQRLLLVAALYIVVLQAVLTYTVPSARAAGLSSFAAGSAFFALNATAATARVVWGRIADRDGGSRRARTLVEAGCVASVGALLFTVALHAGAPIAIPAVLVFGFGALGWNALVYVSAGEKAPVELAGQSVAIASSVVFIVSAVSTPPLGALAERAGWDAFWLTTAFLAAAGALVAASLPRGRPAPAR